MERIYLIRRYVILVLVLSYGKRDDFGTVLDGLQVVSDIPSRFKDFRCKYLICMYFRLTAIGSFFRMNSDM